MNFEIYWGVRDIYLKYKGDIRLKDIIAVNRQISSDSRYGLLKCNISDFRSVKTLHLSDKDLQFIAALHTIPSIWNPNMKLAIVSNNPTFQELILHYIELMKENEWKIRLINNIEESEKWCKSENE
ncbi:MAG: hypothetical protein JW857_09830 [Bacteroidales bacterium]|nr:hypothetical protein [Bacteroidales bacterium]